ncbi:laminin subunit gamma-2-like isoform 2-T2 [Menidia menidia]
MRVSWICAGGLLLAVVFATQAASSHYGSVGAECDSRGRCSCKDGVVGEKCDRCPNGPLGPDGCSHSRQTREDSGSLPCFCYGHSNQCSPQDGFSIHTITSTFSSGPEGWRAATMQGVTPPDVTFRWSPKHQDLEVISKQDLPIYLHAPERFLGDQLLSFGQNFSFSLRLDRGVRRPSTSDLVLEGAGLRAAASLGDLRAILPCGQKIRYSFRLDPGSGWRPQLSSFEFQTLLQNLTDIRIRATFGETGRGYLDDVALVSARPGSGSGSGSDPARWVWACRCPPGLAGRFCQRCAAGFCRVDPVSGAFSACSPDHCDPADQNHRTCPPGTAGPGCDVCEDGFYRQGLQDTCTACGCAPRGSESGRCDGGGRCRCRPGYEGRRCDQAGCPACFSPVRTKMEDYAAKLKALEARLVADGDWSPDTPDGDWALKLMEELVDYLRDTADDLTDTESGLQGWLSSISRRQLLGGGAGREPNPPDPRPSAAAPGVRRHGNGAKDAPGGDGREAGPGQDPPPIGGRGPPGPPHRPGRPSPTGGDGLQPRR